MKILIVIALIAGGLYFVITKHSPFQTELTEPYFVEIRVKDKTTGVELVGFGKMLSYEDCMGRAAIFWANAFKEIGKAEASASCNKELPKRYEPLFNNQQFRASYLVFEKGTESERDGRFVIYGVPSSIVSKECSKIINKIKQTYQGKVFCVQGSVG